MKMNGKLELIIEQRQTISASQVQSLDILSFTNQELDDFMTNEYLENPMLECSIDKEGEMQTNIENLYEKSTSYNEHYVNWQEDDSYRKNDIPAEAPDELKINLCEQLRREQYSERQWNIFEVLIECLNEEGYFVYEPSDIANIMDTSVEEVEYSLEKLRELEPAGIFSRDLSECLQKQLEVKGIEDEKLYTLIGEYLTDILNGQIGVVSRSLKLSTVKVKEYIYFIGKLNPRPIMNINKDEIEYVIPDIIVSRNNEDWEDWNVQINDKWTGEYTYNEYYIKMMYESKDQELIDYFKKKLERARFVVDCVEQRRSTITKVVKTILMIQEDYFEHNAPLKPMRLEDVAEKIDMHVSTVSRAIKGKYLQYRNTVLMKELFMGTVTEVGSGENVSMEEVKNRIAIIIGEEEPQKPLSDQKIADKLKNKGYSISRRTVAKYRTEMGILDSRQRLYF